MARRRKLVGRSLLVASAGLVVACDGGGAVTGNLVAPPMYELCVTADPATAAVQIDGQDLEADGCNSVYEGQSTVTATAEGYLDYEAGVAVFEDTDHTAVLEPAPE